MLGVCGQLGTLGTPWGTRAAHHLGSVGVDLTSAAVGVTAHGHHSLVARGRLHPGVPNIRTGEGGAGAGGDLDKWMGR